MKKSHRLVLEKLPGFSYKSGRLHLRNEAIEQVGRDYEKLEQLANPPMSSADLAKSLAQVAESQNQMMAKLGPMVEGIMNNPNDPRARMMQQMMGMIGGLPAMHNTEAIYSDVAKADLASPSSDKIDGIEVAVNDDLPVPLESATWLSNHFDRLVPGFVEVAKLAYARLQEEPFDKTEAAVYLVDNPTDQDLLNRIRILAVEIGPEYRYTFSLESPCGHFIEHGLCAVFQQDRLLCCGDYSEVSEVDEFSDDDEDF